MKKTIMTTTAVWLGMVCVGVSAPQYQGSTEISEPLSTEDQLPSTLDDVVIPRKTELFITLQQTLSTKAAGGGHKFFGKLVVPVTANDRIIIPVQSYVIGHVLASQRTRISPGWC